MLLFSSDVFAQRLHQVQGTVLDSTGVLFASAIIKPRTAAGSLTAVADDNGT